MYSVMYFMAVALTAATFITERKQGLFDRILVAGKINVVLLCTTSIE